MLKLQQQSIINEMKRTIANIRDADKNADYFFPADKIRSNMNNYFTGLAFALEAVTGKQYHWSNGTDGDTWALVIQKNGKKDNYLYI